MKTMKQLSPMELFNTILYKSRFDSEKLFSEENVFDVKRLLDIGLVQEGNLATTYDCGCGEGGSTVVDWSEHPRDGTRHYFIRCPYCGITRLGIDELRTWVIQNTALVRMISQLLELPSAPMEIISGIVWQLGRKNRRELYYVRRFCDEEMAELRSFLALHPKAVLIVSTQTDKETYSTTLGLNNYCVAVQDFITMDEKYRLTADWSKVELDPLPSAKTKPAAKRGDRAVNIEKLIVELKEHCKAAKSNYEATQKTLPCLTQKEIAKRVGISQREVSRCLNDPNADLLNLYWKQAKNS